VRLHLLLLTPWIMLGIPSQAILGLEVPVGIVVALAGVLGMLLRLLRLALSASLSLISLLVWGKVTMSILRIPPPDTALLLVQFVAIVFLMEASRVILSYDEECRELKGKEDNFSNRASLELVGWLRGQLRGQAKLGVSTLALSVVLLVIGGFSGVSISRVYFSATLVLLFVGALLFLLIHRREPEG
jgi:hypothetical protein